MDVVDCTRISRASARRRVLSRALCQFPEQMSQVASTRFRKGKFLPFHQVSVVIGSSRFQFWVGYTTSTEKWPERFKRQAVILEAIAFRIPLCYWST